MSKVLGEFGTVSGAVVLLSAGLDSSYNLVKALEKFSVRLALTFDYGQRAGVREIDAAKRLADYYLIEHQVVDVSWFRHFSNSTLTGGGEPPRGSEVQIDNLKRSFETAEKVWVPNRNGIFLNIAAGFAEGREASVVIPGFNAEEAATFPDNSEGFLRALDKSLEFSTQGRVRTYCFSTEMDKTQIVADALRVGLDLKMVWPCYFSGPVWCGECESCLRFRRAVEANGLSFAELLERSRS
jgi:7-cyano-7-deazaguanine synthase